MQIEETISPKQISIVEVVIAGNGKNEYGKFVPCDLDQIIERINYQVGKEAIQFSIRTLIRRGLIEKTGTENRRERRRVLISPTMAGKRFFFAETIPGFIENDVPPDLANL